ncbi:TrmH family RNA methyltransferase [Patescibacteria group bacterium]|nr:TrmH family RNA methyltransferase [Patescibacteria group bacterium]
MKRLNSHQLRASRVGESKKLQSQIKRKPLVLVLDNVLDTYNIGCFFRLADALAIKKLYLCGPTVTPPNIKIHRASIGTWKWVPWQHYSSTLNCLQKLKKQGYQLVACEQSKNSRNYKKIKYQKPVALVLGSESLGIGDDVLKLCDLIVEIPMYGINRSLNVLVAASVLSYQIADSI